jgi:alpha-L-fucosidase
MSSAKTAPCCSTFSEADGTIPEHEVYLLHEIGAWLRVNGEAIYATTPWQIYGGSRPSRRWRL